MSTLKCPVYRDLSSHIADQREMRMQLIAKECKAACRLDVQQFKALRTCRLAVEAELARLEAL